MWCTIVVSHGPQIALHKALKEPFCIGVLQLISATTTRIKYGSFAVGDGSLTLWAWTLCSYICVSPYIDRCHDLYSVVGTHVIDSTTTKEKPKKC